MDVINLTCIALSIGIGAISWLNPRYAMASLDLTDGGSTMGMSEVRASAGALFVGMGLGAAILAEPAALVMLGCCWLGAALGRATSLWRDGQTRQKWVFFGVEFAVGALAVLWNI